VRQNEEWPFTTKDTKDTKEKARLSFCFFFPLCFFVSFVSFVVNEVRSFHVQLSFRNGTLMPADVTIRAFGYISSLLEASEVSLPCASQVSVGGILAQLKDRYPLFADYVGQLSGDDDRLLMLCNGQELELSSIIHPGEEVILVTPISGG
jgi:molybdopterin converting factor small subunit